MQVGKRKVFRLSEKFVTDLQSTYSFGSNPFVLFVEKSAEIRVSLSQIQNGLVKVSRQRILAENLFRCFLCSQVIEHIPFRNQQLDKFQRFKWRTEKRYATFQAKLTVRKCMDDSFEFLFRIVFLKRVDGVENAALYVCQFS